MVALDEWGWLDGLDGTGECTPYQIGLAAEERPVLADDDAGYAVEEAGARACVCVSVGT